MIGMKMSPTSDSTILPKAAPMIDADREVDDVAPQREFLEFLEHRRRLLGRRPSGRRHAMDSARPAARR